MTKKKTGIGSYPADERNSSRRETKAGGANSANKRSGKLGLARDPDRIQRDLDRYREELVEDAPASSSREDNP